MRMNQKGKLRLNSRISKLVFGLAILLMTGPGLLAQRKAERAAAPRTRVDSSDRPQFPLMAWDYVDDRDTLKAMQECGITSIAFVRANMLDACQEYGLKAIVFDERISGSNWSKPFDGDQAVRNLPAVIKEVGNHPAVLG